MTLETIAPIASIVFYGLVFIVAVILAIYKMVKKAKNGEDITPDLDKLSDSLATIFTKKTVKTATKNNVTVNSEEVKDTLKNAVSSIMSVQSIEQTEQKSNEKKI